MKLPEKYNTILDKFVNKTNLFNLFDFQKLDEKYQETFLAGLIDGESNFHVGIAKTATTSILSTLGYNWHVTLNFQLYQANFNQNIEFLNYFNQKFFGGERLVKRKNDKSSKSDVWFLECSGTKKCIKYLLPFLERNPLAFKNYDSQIFLQVIHLMQDEEHLSRDGFRLIVHLAFLMNDEGKQRRTKKEDILKDIDPQFDYLDRNVNRRRS